MPIEITMPRLSDTMEEGTLVKWRVGVGDTVASGDHLADVETDKATMELQAFDDGTVAKINIDEGATVPVGDTILILAGEGESVDEAAKSAGQAKKTESPEPASEKPAAKPQAAASGGGDGKTVRVSPLARKLAEEHGVDLSTVTGTGPNGRIIKRDVLGAAKGGAPAPAASTTPAAPISAEPTMPAADFASLAASLEAEEIELSQMRKTIAKRLVESKTTIPHFTVTVAVDMDPLIALRKTLNEQLESQGVKLSVNDFIVRAAALTCVQHPTANSSWGGDRIIQHGTVNVGIAVSLPPEKGGGLTVPVIRDAHHKGLRQISQDTKTLAGKARKEGLKPEEMADGTFTISNLGMYGVASFEAIINPPQAAILAVGGAVEQPVVRGGQLAVGHVMNATLSADHRVLDGSVAAEFLATFKQMMENPAGLLV